MNELTRGVERLSATLRDERENSTNILKQLDRLNRSATGLLAQMQIDTRTVPHITVPEAHAVLISNVEVIPHNTEQRSTAIATASHCAFNKRAGFMVCSLALIGTVLVGYNTTLLAAAIAVMKAVFLGVLLFFVLGLLLFGLGALLLGLSMFFPSNQLHAQPINTAAGTEPSPSSYQYMSSYLNTFNIFGSCTDVEFVNQLSLVL